MAKQADISQTPYLLLTDGKVRITELSARPEDKFWQEYQELWQKIVYLAFGIGPLKQEIKDSNGQG